jgi:single-stranded-DNA-specific exonuclease
LNKIKWIIANEDEELRNNIAHQFSLEPIIAQLLINRGLKNIKDIDDFLNPRLDNLLDPLSLQGMARTVERIKKALNNQEKILIYGDYDVDGITSTTLLFSVLTIFSANVYYYIPDRFEEGYGISQKGIQFALKYHISLIITVDCGITSHQEIKQLIDMGIDTIVTDHHEPLKNLPKAYSIINPKNCDYPFKDLAGVGVVFKLVQALHIMLGKDHTSLYEHLDLVALGTIADSMPILGENRILVKYGIKNLINSKKKGLKKLVKHCQNNNLSNNLTVRDISFNLIPVLNSTGRIGNPKQAVDLLLTDSSYRADYLVSEMLKLNEERKGITQKVLNEARKMATNSKLKNNNGVLVLSSDKWHPGIIGIVASRVMEEHSQPVIIISTSNGIGKGSGRNQGEFDFSKILSQCSDLLIKYGGHQYAAGITISRDKIDGFRERINCLLDGNQEINQYNEPIINIDALIAIDTMNWAFLDYIEKLRPFGPGNQQPVFCGYNFPLVSLKKVGKDEKHLKLNLGEGGNYFDGIAFQMADKYTDVIDDSTIDIVFQLGMNCWNGKKTIQLMIKDIKSTVRRTE